MSEIRSQATPAYKAVANRRAATHALHHDLIDGGPKIDAKFSDIHHMAGNAIKAGWLKPRTVNSATELKDLPNFSLIRALEREGQRSGDVFEKVGPDHWLALDPGDRFDGEVTTPSHAIVLIYKAGIRVLFTPGDA